MSIRRNHIIRFLYSSNIFCILYRLKNSSKYEVLGISLLSFWIVRNEQNESKSIATTENLMNEWQLKGFHCSVVINIDILSISEIRKIIFFDWTMWFIIYSCCDRSAERICTYLIFALHAPANNQLRLKHTPGRTHNASIAKSIELCFFVTQQQPIPLWIS